MYKYKKCRSNTANKTISGFMSRDFKLWRRFLRIVTSKDKGPFLMTPVNLMFSLISIENFQITKKKRETCLVVKAPQQYASSPFYKRLQFDPRIFDNRIIKMHSHHKKAH